MEKIINFSEVESATFTIICGSKSGTAFFINVNKSEQLLLTSEHTLSSSDNSLIHINKFNEEPIELEIVEKILSKDIAILRVKNQMVEGITTLPLFASQITVNDSWETYGFPAKRVINGGKYSGIVSRLNENKGNWDIDLDCEQYNKLSDFEGLSGSPLIIGGFVVGVIGYDLQGTFGATSIFSIVEILQKYEVEVFQKDTNTIPKSLEQDIEELFPNEEVLKNIHTVIEQHSDNGYFLISGSPGSGKTTIAAQIKLKHIHVICGRYFVKVPEDDAIPTQIRASPEYFMKWLEEVYYKILYNTLPPKQKSDEKHFERVQRVLQGLNDLSDYYRRNNQIGYLIIDGLNDVSPDKIDDFLSVLPTSLPSNLKVILSCTGSNILPKRLQAIITQSLEVKVTPLLSQVTEEFLEERLRSKGLTLSQITQLAQKSEGHPLYLRYLTKYVLNFEENTGIGEWINSVPVIGGDIEKYYENIWLQLDEQADTIWLVATLSRLRVDVERDLLCHLLPPQTQYAFEPIYKTIQHLLRVNEKISIYHTSFSDFVNLKTQGLNTNVQCNISNYCNKQPTSYFSISEKIFHFSNANEDYQRQSLDECNQDWVDQCTINGLNPDVVLSDIRATIELAAKKGISYKVISLLLLAQRVNFRYNVLFNDNTIFLVNALLALNKACDAIKYVVRNDTLMVSDNDALYLLQRFYEYEAIEEAEKLLKAIEYTSSKILEEKINDRTFNRFISLKLNSITLSYNSDSEQAHENFIYFQSKAIEILNEPENKTITNKFRDDFGSYRYGYLLWRFKITPVTKLLEELKSFNCDNRSTGFIALSILNALEFENQSPIFGKNESILTWVEDLEYSIDKYNIHSDYFFVTLFVLLGRSKRVDIIEKIFKNEYQNKEVFKLRKENGVDINHQGIRRTAIYYECIGFLDTADKYPKIKQFSYSNWESNIKDLLEYFYFLRGKVKRFTVDGNEDQVLHVIPQLNHFLNVLIPNLSDRMYWERSYSIPEKIFPLIYTDLVTLLLDFFPTQIPYFVQLITNQDKYQLGLYTEGYTDCLFATARLLARASNQELNTYKVVKVLENHVINTVENRLERNEYLLKLVELYAMLKNEDKATQIFKEMLDTSMGPSWYKEDQLGIINSVVSNIIPCNGDHSYLQKFAVHLHHASGEMTFQRYVKQQKESFVGDLAKSGFLKKAISYLKYLLLPDYATIIKNAESDMVDMPIKGEGYILGARAIEEQSGVLNLLSNIDCNSSLVAWGLTELFIVGDDRYLSKFAKIQAKMLNHSEIHNVSQLDNLFKRVVRFVITEVEDEFRFEYLRALFHHLSNTNFEKLKVYLETAGMKPNNPQDESRSESNYKDEDDPLDKLMIAKKEALMHLEMDNISGARKVIISALTIVQKEKYGIWSSNYSHKIDELRSLLSKTYTNSSELITNISSLIINEPYSEEWVIANNIIRLLKNIKDEGEKQDILSAVLEHIDLLVRTPKDKYDDYNWLAVSGNLSDSCVQEEILLDFLIWLLNHPSLILKNRTIEIIVWLGIKQPATVIPTLVREILTEGYKISKEISASILHQISTLNPSVYWKEFKICLEKEGNKVIEIPHFMIRQSLLESLHGVKSHGIQEADIWLDKFKLTFSKHKKNGGEVFLEEEYLEPIEDYLYELNALGILTKQFCETILKQVKINVPITIEDSQKASKYIDRTFNNYNDIQLVSDFDTILRYSLNVAIMSCVIWEDREKVSSILRFYQPTFAENRLSLNITDNKGEKIENTIKEFFKTGEIKITELLADEELLINYYSSEFSKNRRDFDNVLELEAFLIPIKSFWNSDQYYPWIRFKANSYPNSVLEEMDDDVIPLIAQCEDTMNVIGGELIPSIPLDTITLLSPKANNNVKLNYWRRGRNWEQYKFGVALKSSYTLSVSSVDFITLKTNYKLIWQVSNRNDVKYIDVLEQKEIL